MSIEATSEAPPPQGGAAGPAPEGLFAAGRGPLVVGLALTVTLVAFEALAVATIMPDVKDDLGGLGLYGWVFSGFFLGSLLGIVLAGDLVDRRGLVPPYLFGLAMFAAGLLVGGFAVSMPMLVGGRILQGIGAGAIPATGYAAIGRGVPAPLRPKMFAVLSTAWVVPGLAGPSLALLLEHALSWRAVFLVLVPLVAVAGVVTVPAIAPFGRVTDDEADAEHAVAARRRLRLVLVLVAGLGAVSAAATGAALVLAVPLVAVGLPVAAWALVQLLPPGTLRLSPGIPVTVAARGVLTFAFFAADAFVPLAVVDGRNGSNVVSGVALTLCTLAWAVASWVQARLIERLGPRTIDQLGFAALAVASLGLVGAALGMPVWTFVPAWTIGGFGIGLAYAPQAVTVLGLAGEGDEGSASASIQLADGVGVAIGTGLAGAVVAFGNAHGWEVADSVLVVFAIATAGALAGVLVAGRLPRVVPHHDPA
ncbi:MAG: MFS transporter [Acidimicrobiales bacterium]